MTFNLIECTMMFGFTKCSSTKYNNNWFKWMQWKKQEESWNFTCTFCFMKPYKLQSSWWFTSCDLWPFSHPKSNIHETSPFQVLMQFGTWKWEVGIKILETLKIANTRHNGNKMLQQWQWHQTKLQQSK
jgi:hypothetical protein